MKLISKNDLLKLIGLFTLYNELQKQRESIESAAADILQLSGDDDYDRGGYILMDNSGCTIEAFEKVLNALEK